MVEGHVANLFQLTADVQPAGAAGERRQLGFAAGEAVAADEVRIEQEVVIVDGDDGVASALIGDEDRDVAALNRVPEQVVAELGYRRRYST
jgi:hypothetical protein